MAATFVVLFVTLLAGSLGSVIETAENVVVKAETADEDLPYRFDYAFSDLADGWLKLHRAPASWNDAKIRCHAEGAILASPLTADLQEALLRKASREPVSAILTGAHAVYSEGVYNSVEGVPLSDMPITWALGEPRSVRSRCIALNTRGGTVGTVGCDDGLPYICYKPRTHITLTPCGTSDTEYILHPRIGKCYKFHTRGLDWTKAYLTCIAEGGHLAIINSASESTVLRELYGMYDDNSIDAAYTISCHIGFRDMRDGGAWFTINGQTLAEAGYNGWGDSQPDNSTQFSPAGESCGAITRNGQLNDVWCGLNAPFICEKNANSLTTVLV